ncbi:DUF6701 domain-containing protein [Photobacterium aquimaris]|uniref:DUF6701 domain-containing protein n=1 Tax=Photobacterium aquimaris TaxID=512643 RepID=A0A2T3I164_9GAMM|nr:DUF6701 domain-containing protein [Photobacterium aquimaris]OBU26182.1 hypothetical protein AYY21_07735 [Photobacterium aquimaris]PQJ42057.1 hypothetical protein BTN98_10910 [Photobacterium aquimaris]PSU10241.1 hypothetical protein C0W81_04435 [Photobacterium aquimaris]
MISFLKTTMRLWSILLVVFAINAMAETDINHPHTLISSSTKSQTQNFCEYFPQLAQSHSKVKLDGQLIRMGFQYPYFKSNNNKKYQLGFNHFIDRGGDKDKSCQNNTEQKWACDINSALIVKPKKMPVMPTYDIPEEGFTCQGLEQYKDKCIEYYGNNILFLTKGDYLKVELGANTNTQLQGGIYKIKSLLVRKGANITVATGKQAIIYVEEAEFSGKINKDGLPDNLYIFGTNNDAGSVVSESHMEASIRLSTTVEMSAYLYSAGNIKISANYGEGIAITDRPKTLRGAVTARNLRIDTDSNIWGGGSCVQEKEYDLVVTPKKAQILSCDRVPITFNVHQKNNPQLDTTYNGNLVVSTSLSQPALAYWFTSQNSNTNPSDASQPINVRVTNGVGKLWLKSDNYIGNIDIKAVLQSSNHQPATATGQYTVVPFKFLISSDPLKVIANKPHDITVTAMACSDDINTHTIATGYSGTRTLSLKTQFIAPSTQGNSKVELRSLPQRSWSMDEVQLVFEKGVAKGKLRYSDAGKVMLNIIDRDCNSDQGCDIGSPLRFQADDWTQLDGSVVIQSRPWTFAICPQANDSFTGTASRGNGLVAAGDAFVMRAKPLQWQPGDKVNNSIDVSDDKYCQRSITPNFFAQAAPVATVTAKIAGIHSPENGEQGKLSGTVSQQNTEFHDDAVLFNDLRWSEVGSVKLAMTADSYLGMTINPSQRAIGRFYPKKFELIKSDIINAHTESTPFTYMDQTFTANAIIEAQNAAGEATLNYGKFAPQLKESLLLTAVDLNQNRQLNDVSARLDQSNLSSGWQHQWQQAQLTIKDGELAFTRLPKPNNQLATTTTTADGPFKIGLGLSVIPRTDCSALGCTDFANKTQVLQRYNQLQLLTASLDGNVDSRYGRMVLEDASGVFNQPLTMPLKVEYWKNGQFILNEDDSTSLFNSELSCKQMIYDVSKPHDKAHFMSTSGNINDGKSYALQVSPGVAENGPYLKQQWRFWLRIAAQPAGNIDCSVNQTTHQPWLTFNWRGVGDEDPSGLVTFGSYRGNDRIIYRSETALINP